MVLLPTSFILILIGKVMMDAPPDKRNKWVGYRTKSSIKTNERWEFSQKESSKSMFKINSFLLPISIPFFILDILMIIKNTNDFWFVGSLVVQALIIVAGLFLIFVLTEKSLQQKFK